MKYRFELVDQEEQLVMLNFGVTEKQGPLLVKVKARDGGKQGQN